MKKNYRKIILCLVILAITGISVGYAALSTTLTITGTATAKTNSWNVAMQNIANKTGTVTPTTAPTVSGNTLSYALTLTKPGDYYSFTFDVKNSGSLPAKLSAVPTITGSSSYITHTVTYSDGTAIASGDTIAAGASKTFKVKVTYRSDLTAGTLPTSDSQTTYSVTLNYIQG